jgi:hypothetical protein
MNLTFTLLAAMLVSPAMVQDERALHISACLWDLRAQCEEKLRVLTHAQRLMDCYRDDGQQPHTQKRLQGEIESFIRLNATTRDIAGDCLRLVSGVAAERTDGTA